MPIACPSAGLRTIGPRVQFSAGCCPCGVPRLPPRSPTGAPGAALGRSACPSPSGPAAFVCVRRLPGSAARAVMLHHDRRRELRDVESPRSASPRRGPGARHRGAAVGGDVRRRLRQLRQLDEERIDNGRQRAPTTVTTAEPHRQRAGKAPAKKLASDTAGGPGEKPGVPATPKPLAAWASTVGAHATRRSG